MSDRRIDIRAAKSVRVRIVRVADRACACADWVHTMDCLDREESKAQDTERGSAPRKDGET